MAEDSNELRNLVAQVASAYFSNSHVVPSDIPAVINQIAASLTSVGDDMQGGEQTSTKDEEPKKLTAAQIRKSITPAALISFEDGRGYKTLRRHLASRGLSPEQYREKWGLPATYPLVAPDYSAARSQMAKNLGLGQLRRKDGAKPVGRPRKKT